MYFRRLPIDIGPPTHHQKTSETPHHLQCRFSSGMQVMIIGAFYQPGQNSTGSGS